MKRWTAISHRHEEPRWRLLAEGVNAAHGANEFVPWSGPPNDINGVEALGGFDHVRVSAEASAKVLSMVKVQSSKSTLIGVIDGLVQAEGGWWPLCALYEALGQVLIRVGQRLDLRGHVLLAGEGGSARVAIAAFFKAGFKNFLITSVDRPKAEEMIRDVRGKLFGLSLEFVPLEKIVLLPSECTVLINCNTASDDSPLVNELSYLNFLKRPAFLFDTTQQAKPSTLVKEAADSGVAVIDSAEIAARTDVLWAKWAFGVDLPLVEYQASLRTIMSGATSPTATKS